MTRAHYSAFSLALALTFALFAGIAQAQVSTGTPLYGSFGGGPDVINLADLNSHISIPIVHKSGRGTDFTYDLSYDSSVWYPSSASGINTWTPVTNWGWRGQTEVAVGYVSYKTHLHQCPVKGDGNYPTYDTYVFHDMFGIMHAYVGSAVSDCNGIFTGFTETAADGSGYKINVTDVSAETITSSSGQVSNPPVNNTTGASTATDRNGNQFSVNSSNQFFDTLSSTPPVLSITGSGSAGSPLTFTYTAPGGSASYKVNYTNYTVATNFAVSGIAEYKSTAAVPLVSSVVLADGSQYSFTYEPTPTTPSSGACTPYAGTTCVTARLAQITLPTSGTIKYAYSGGSNGIFSDGSTAILTRTLTPGGAWTYAQVKGSGAASTTTVTDPQSNVTTIQFQGIYETQRQIASLLTANTCYNGATSPCLGTAITLPITQRSTITTLGTQQSKHVDSYNASSGVLTESDDYDYGTGAPGALIKKVLITYAPLGNITAFRQLVTLCNGSSTASACNGTGTVVSQTKYNYDETAVVANTATTPQHVAVAGSRGNLTSINYPVGTLTSKSTYFDTGILQTSTDVNGAVTTYNFPDATSTCGNAFPTSITEPLSLGRSMTWNCTGAVQLTAKDENLQIVQSTYTDPYFWRPNSSIDQLSNVTNLVYDAAPSPLRSHRQ
jgi:hypothetical protein